MNLDLLKALDDIEKDKGIAKDVLLEAIEAALLSAYKKDFGSKENVSVEVNEETGQVMVFSRKKVVEEIKNDNYEILLENAKKIDSEVELEEYVDVEITPDNFGRIAAQTAKQVVMQRIREAERDVLYEDYKRKEGEIITGTIQRFHKDNVLIDMGKTEALLPVSEQIPTEQYKVGFRLKLYVVEVSSTTKGPRILVSRTHPALLKRLFEVEVPEIFDGIVEIRSVAREAGFRSKVAVFSYDSKVDPVGACVGPQGRRVKSVVEQLDGEKIDIVKYSDNPEDFVSNALNPAEVKAVVIDEQEQSATVVVPDFQLSLAIGKEGQNARLAAKLTGWKIDIKKESEFEEMQKKQEEERERNEELEEKDEKTIEETEEKQTDEQQKT
ncbi:MAG: transcription termination/antitermination protein NusA [Halanaerobiales bacterium]|nr:transcription termination/antitermination protein NusA [Halanaerobiales bacterium]